MIDKILEKLAKPIKHPILVLILFYIISFVLLILLLNFNLIKLKTAKISMLLCLTAVPLGFSYFKVLCIEEAYKNKTSFIPGIIVTIIMILIAFLFISLQPDSTKVYTKLINLKNGNAKDNVSVSTESHSALYGGGYTKNFIHCKGTNNKVYKVELESGIKIKWKKSKKSKVKLVMTDVYSVFGNKQSSKATNVTVYYTSK